jgi:cell division protease FtsH
VLARGTPGFSGADLANLVNEAALNAARYGKKAVMMEDFEGAKDKVLMGTERKSLIISEEEKKVTAYHEAGHALVAAVLPDADPLHKVTIIPRGMALGVTQQLPIDDRHNYSREYLRSEIAVMMGGRVAEEMYLKKITTGAGNDLEQATDMARRMVCEWGMSDVMGPLTFGKKEEQIFLGREIAQHQDYSETTAALIDKEVKKLVLEGYEKAREILSTHADALHRIAQALLEYEVLAGEEVMGVLRGEEISPHRERKRPRPVPESPRPEPEKAKGEFPEKSVIPRDPLKQPG